MKLLTYDYLMQIDYTEMVKSCNYTIKCIPKTTLRQRPVSKIIDIYPKNEYCTGIDGLGNEQVYGLNDIEHKKFYFHISGEVETGLADYEETAIESNAMIFRHPHGLNTPGSRIKNYYEELKGVINILPSNLLKAIYVMHRLHDTFMYQARVTTIKTTAEEALALGHGVCQDYAHIFIALMHLNGIAARYVTGLLIGEGASHAWVEILDNGKWIGLDPTNDTLVDEDHIKIGVGRDAHDCMINRGIMHGGGFHTQTINVSVKEKI